MLDKQEQGRGGHRQQEVKGADREAGCRLKQAQTKRWWWEGCKEPG